MDIPLNVEVHCSDGMAGHSTCIILNPLTRTITHFVLRRQHMLGDDVLVSVDLIKESTPDLILLDCPLEKLSDLEAFNKGYFLGFDATSDNSRQQPMSKYANMKVMAWPYQSYGEPYGVYVIEEQIPLNGCPIHRGAEVEAADGWVGKVNEFLVQPQGNSITHLVLRENHFWGDQAVSIPVSQISRIDKDIVAIKLTREEVKALPHLLIH